MKTDMGKLGMVLAVFLLVGSVFAGAVMAEHDGKKGQKETEVYTVEFLEEAFRELTPFITVNDDHTLTLDVKKAKKEGLSHKIIKVGQEFVEINNELVTGLQAGTYSSETAQKLKKFEPFFLKVAKGEYASGEVTTQDACGGGFTNPHRCPPWNYPSSIWSTRQGVVNYLTGLGYHQTASYACGDPVDPCPNDFTKVVSAYGCPNGPIRSQAIVYQSGSYWKYRYQTPEPNPEINSYSWPAWWWGEYVWWWHVFYC